MEDAYYEQEGLWQEARYLENAEETRRYQVLAEVLPGEVQSLLDVGTGNGAFLRHLEERGRPASLAGVERSRAAMARAVCRTPLREADASALPFDDGSVDAVSLCEVLEHLPCRVYEQAIAEATRVARTHVLVSVPFRERREFLHCPACGSEFPQFLHLRTFDERRLRCLVPGFSLLRLERVWKRQQPKLPHPGRLYRRLRRLPLPMSPGAVCPVCGFQAAPPIRDSIPDRPVGWRGLYRRMLPHVRVPWWAVALYGREG